MPRDDIGFGADIRAAVDAAPIIIDPRAPFTTAKVFLDQNFNSEAGRLLHHHRGDFYLWTGAAYGETPDEDMRARAYNFLDNCLAPGKPGETRPVHPNTALVSNVLDGLRAAAHLDADVDSPAWLNGSATPDLDAADIIPCANGLLHLPTLSLLPHTPNFFAHNALDFAYEATALEPREWLKFLGQIWPNDQQSIDTLQEIFGLCLTGDTRHQKAFLVVGPKRSGKGTIARIQRRLVGAANTAAPTLSSLATNFGLQPLIGKRLAIISDARLGGHADQAAIAERLLSITGEDSIGVDRKFRETWNGKLQIRFLILTNELPRLADASGALAGRFIVLTLTESFYGREDQGLTDRLLTELPSILNWSLVGIARLRQRGYFVQPASGAEAIQTLEDLGSPISAFLRDRCTVGPQFTVARTRLFEVWTEWCKAEGRDHPGTAESLGRDLRAAIPTLRTVQPRADGERLRLYRGIGLR